MKMTQLISVAGMLALLLLGGCRTYPDYTGDFRFPINQGNVAQGQQAFQSLGCVQCHAVTGVELTRPTTPALTVVLGGELMTAKTYGDLVTSIINPDHVISERYLQLLDSEQRRAVKASPMYVNPEMKVAELIDIVAFLNSRYSLVPGYTEYFY